MNGDQKVRAIPLESPETWEEVFAVLDATGVRDGFVIERDMRPAKERAALDRFLSGANISE